MSHLRPHTWDGFGPPPPVGPDYDTAAVEAVLAYIADLAEVDRLRDEADSLHEEASRAEDAALRAATNMATRHPLVSPRLARAIEIDRSGWSAAQIRSWLAEPPTDSLEGPR